MEESNDRSIIVKAWEGWANVANARIMPLSDGGPPPLSCPLLRLRGGWGVGGGGWRPADFRRLGRKDSISILRTADINRTNINHVKILDPPIALIGTSLRDVFGYINVADVACRRFVQMRIIIVENASSHHPSPPPPPSHPSSRPSLRPTNATCQLPAAYHDRRQD